MAIHFTDESFCCASPGCKHRTSLISNAGHCINCTRADTIECSKCEKEFSLSLDADLFEFIMSHEECRDCHELYQYRFFYRNAKPSPEEIHLDTTSLYRVSKKPGCTDHAWNNENDYSDYRWIIEEEDTSDNPWTYTKHVASDASEEITPEEVMKYFKLTEEQVFQRAYESL